MLLVSGGPNHYGGRFGEQELQRIAELVVDSPVLVGHRKDTLPIARVFQADVITHQGERAAQVVIRDITERNRLEKRIQQSQKLESLGRLAGGIAHDFNNLLLPIMVLSQMTMEEFPRESAVRERMGKVVRAAESARNLVARILLFAHEEEPRLDICEICVVVRQAMELMESLLPSTIKIKVNLDPDTGIVSADAAQIETVLLNLASNAADAMNGKPGELELSLSRVEVDGKLASSVPGLKAGAYAMLSVADSGHGMDENTMNHLFDPFFTTKEVGEGTGLGLSTVHGIVTRHGGAIDVSSMPGLGSRFDVYLPLQKLRKMKHRPKKSRKREVARMTE
ncbi:MAG: hypothetical protein IH897_16120 [Planctomycetes bacterium]|nr:hypothetical protein [Planctomycetota bacterium]